MTFSSSLRGALLCRRRGNEALNAGNSAAAGALVGRNDVAGGDSIVGGSGNDIFFLGAGAGTLVVEAGPISSSSSCGNADAILDIRWSDLVYLTGYGASAATTVLSNAAFSGGNKLPQSTTHGSR